MAEAILNKYDYTNVDQVCYSDPACESYKKAAAFLGPDLPVEDWGGGTAWAKRYFTGPYKNIDASPGPHVDEVADLANYRSKATNILMRQVLELNPDWKTILRNALQSFSNKMCIVICTPPSDTVTKVHELDAATQISLYALQRDELIANFSSTKYRITDELVQTNQCYGQDWIIYIEKL